MLNILDKKYSFEDNKIVCLLEVEFNKNSKLLNCGVNYHICSNVMQMFSRKYKNIIKEGFGYNAVFAIRGVAKCNPNDVYNKEKGVKIALYRALHKLNTMEMELMNMYSSKLFSEGVLKFDALQEKTRLHINKNLNILKELTK